MERERECQNSVPEIEKQLFCMDVGFLTWHSPSYTYICIYPRNLGIDHVPHYIWVLWIIECTYILL